MNWMSRQLFKKFEQFAKKEDVALLATSDVAKFNTQYPALTVTTSAMFHDRFLILDQSEIYLIGASLKDLGKKCFAFSKLDAANIDAILAKING